MAKRWILLPDEGDRLRALATRLGVSETLARCLLRRGLGSAEPARAFLRPSLEFLHDPSGLPDVEKGAERLARAIRSGEPAWILGDYDADGMLGTALLHQFFRVAGGRADAHIPDRTREGYSLGEAAIDRIRRGGYRLVVTVDNGASATDAIARLSSDGVDVVVTDHHLPARETPPAYALVNPRRPDSRYPFPFLCGTAVAFKLAWAAADRFSSAKRTSADLRAFLLDALGFVALASIADVVPLVGENRVLVRFGLAALPRTTNPGLRALLASSRLEGRELRADEVSFRVVPKLNAAGRLGESALALECLTTPSYERALACVRDLERLNARRQRLDRAASAEARERLLAEGDPRRDPILFVASEEWHAGVAGLVAARLAEEFDRPAAVVAVDGGKARGSMRTVRGVPLAGWLEECSDLLASYGGHEYAAGFEVRPGRIEDLRRRLREVADRRIGRNAPEPPLPIDAEVDFVGLTPDLMEEVRRLEPFGEGNPAPVFVTRAVEAAATPRATGPSGRDLVFPVRQRGVMRRAYARTIDLPREGLRTGEPFALAYTPRPFRGFGEVELRVRDLAREPKFATVT